MTSKIVAPLKNATGSLGLPYATGGSLTTFTFARWRLTGR